jgi:hypothetical protein
MERCWLEMDLLHLKRPLHRSCTTPSSFSLPFAPGFLPFLLLTLKPHPNRIPPPPRRLLLLLLAAYLTLQLLH